MEKQIKTIGVLTSGGDAPGMNAAVRAVVRTGLHKGFRMIGIQRGYNGLLNGECFEMNLRSVSNIISAGGTILYTARCLEFKTKEGQDKGAEKCRELGIDALVVIGGDGSYRGARALAHRGIPMIGLPGTIDNDIGCTDYTIGYDTAMNTALEMIDKLRDTTQSHDRCSVVEVTSFRKCAKSTKAIPQNKNIRQKAARNFSRPISSFVMPSLRMASTIFASVAMEAWSVPGSHRAE